MAISMHASFKLTTIADQSIIFSYQEKNFTKADMLKSNSSCLLARLHLTLLYLTNTACAGMARFIASSVVVIKRGGEGE